MILRGTLGETFGLGAALWVGAVGNLLAFLWVFCSPVRTLREMQPLRLIQNYKFKIQN